MFDPYWQWLKIPPEQRPPTHYELLGLPPYESDAARIHKAVMERMAVVRRYQLGEHAETVVALLNELSAAFNCLSDPQRRREYDEQLRTADTRPLPVPVRDAAATVPSGSLPALAAEKAIARPASSRNKKQRLPWLIGTVLAVAAVAAIVWFSQQPRKVTVQQTELVAGSTRRGNATAQSDGNRIEAVPTDANAEPARAKPAEIETPPAAEPSIRYFGYATAGPGPVVNDIAPYTNVVFVRDWVEHPSGVLGMARQAGLPIVLCLQGKEMVDGAERLKAVLQRGSEPFLAVCWFFPYSAGYKPVDVINVGRRLKQEHPNVQFWMAGPDKSASPPENDIVPVNVDAIVVVGLADTTPKLVEAEAEECLPRWLEKAWGRPIIWLWLSNSRSNKAGLVPAVTPGTFRAYLEQARRYKLAGLVFDTYGQPPWQERAPLESRPELVDEIRQISRELGYESGQVGTARGQTAP